MRHGDDDARPPARVEVRRRVPGHRAAGRDVGRFKRLREIAPRDFFRDLAIEHGQIDVGLAGLGHRVGQGGQRAAGERIGHGHGRAGGLTEEHVQLGGRGVAFAPGGREVIVRVGEFDGRLHVLETRHVAGRIAGGGRFARAERKRAHVCRQGHARVGGREREIRAPHVIPYARDRAGERGLARRHRGIRQVDAPAALAAQFDRQRRRERLARCLALGVVLHVGVGPFARHAHARLVDWPLQACGGDRRIRVERAGHRGIERERRGGRCPSGLSGRAVRGVPTRGRRWPPRRTFAASSEPLPQDLVLIISSIS